MTKELESLERLRNTLLAEGYWQDVLQDVAIIETALKQLAKKNKVLKIVKKKGNFLNLEYDEYRKKYYIYDNELYMHNEITKEEYDLLKEVLF